jgi:acetate---CoA ligase (ADP-forming)
MTAAPRDAVSALLSPKSVAIVGASDRSRWSLLAFENLTRSGSSVELRLVNRRGGQVHGRVAAESCAALGHEIDLGVVLVPKEGVVAALADLAAAKARSAVILTSGFAETGPSGRDLQQQVTTAAAAHGVRLLGPNCLGFINFVDEVRVWTTPVREPSRKEGIAIVSQSGATALFLSDLAYQQDVGLSYVVSTGNEADLDVASFIEHLIDDRSTRAIALFIETIRHPERFLRAAQRALENGKPVVVLKVGASEATARTAQAHTGALVGDDRVFDGVCRQYGLLRVRSLEELLATANVLALTGELEPGGLCIVSNSGGISEIAADTAHLRGVELPQPSAEARAEVGANMPDFATANNPLDVTGGIEPHQCGAVIDILSRQPEYAAILCPWYEIPTSEDRVTARTSELHRQLSSALVRAPIPGLLVSYTHTQITDFSRSVIREIGAPYLACGLDRAISGIAGAMWWSARRRKREPIVVARREANAPTNRGRPRSEREALAFLAAAGVPVVPGTLARDAEEAAAAARALGGAIVLKIASPDIAHKSDIGGVALNLEGAEAVAAAFERVTSSVRASAPNALVEGVLVSPMRERGIELLVGCTRDPEWGWVLAVGLGGVWVEILKDVSLRLLPASESVIREMLSELRGAKLLSGQRGIPAADIEAVAQAARRIGEAALGCGDALVALEVNPLWVRGGQVEALDALFVWREDAGATGAHPAK